MIELYVKGIESIDGLYMINKPDATIINYSKINILLTFGELSKFSSKKITNSKIFAKHFQKHETLIAFIKTNLKKNDVIYIKGSRSMQLNKIIKKL